MVHQWDVRAGQNQLAIPQRQHGITSLDVHPSQPYQIALGDDHGAVSIWDLRKSSTSPLWSTHCIISGGGGGSVSGGSGSVSGVCHVGRRDGLLVSTSDGVIGLVAHGRVDVLYVENGGGVRSLCGCDGEEVLALTDQEVLLYFK